MYPRGPRQSKQFSRKNVSGVSPPIKKIFQQKKLNVTHRGVPANQKQIGRKKCFRGAPAKSIRQKQMAARGSRQSNIRQKKINVSEGFPPVEEMQTKKCLRCVRTNQTIKTGRKKWIREVPPPPQSKKFTWQKWIRGVPPIKTIRQKNVSEPPPPPQ